MSTVKMMVYGNPGVGKTVFCSTANNAAMIDAEAGTMSIANRIKNGDVKVLHARTYDDIEQAIDRLDAASGTDSAPATIVIDSLSEVLKKCMDKQLADYPDTKRTFRGVPSLQDFGAANDKFSRLVRRIRDLDYNVVVTSLAQDRKNEVTGAVATVPDFNGKLPEAVASFFDIVGYMTAEATPDGTVRAIHVQPTGTFIAKDRSGLLPDVIESPNFEQIREAIFGNDQNTDNRKED